MENIDDVDEQELAQEVRDILVEMLAAVGEADAAGDSDAGTGAIDTAVDALMAMIEAGGMVER